MASESKKEPANCDADAAEASKSPYAITYHDEHFLKNFKGQMILYPHYLTLDEVQTFEASPHDVIVCSIPKAGTMWLTSVVAGILADGNPDVFRDGVPITKKSTMFCSCQPDSPKELWPIMRLKSRPPGRQIHTHLAYQCLPPSVVPAGAKKIYIYRNPKDVAVSLYFFLQLYSAIQFKGDLNDVVDTLVNGTSVWGPLFDHLASYWSRRHEDPNIFFCSFEEMKKNFFPTVTRMAMFLGKELTEEQLMVIHRETDFAASKTNPLLNMSVHQGVYDLTKHEFVREGSIGQWKRHFTPEINAKMDAWISRNLQRPELCGIKFDYE